MIAPTLYALVRSRIALRGHKSLSAFCEAHGLDYGRLHYRLTTPTATWPDAEARALLEALDIDVRSHGAEVAK